MEWVLLAVVALLLFGGTRLAGLGKGAGRAIREFKEETQGVKKDKAAPESPAGSPKQVQQATPGATEPVVDAEVVEPSTEKPANP